MLRRKCCRASTLPACWLSDWRRLGALSNAGACSCALLLVPGRDDETARGGGRSARLADLELPWLEDRLWCRPPSFAASIRPGRDIGGPCLVPFWGVEVLLSERPWARLLELSSSRNGALRSGWGNDVWDELISPSLASLSRLSRLSRCRSACLSACRRRTASAILSVISSSCVVPMSFRSTPSASSSSSTCLTRSSSTSSAPRSDALSSDRRLA